MLNEIEEYQLYLSKFIKKIPLFYKKNIEDGLSGIDRPLSVLARGFLSKCNSEGLDKTKSIRCCILFLCYWYGYTLIDSETFDFDIPEEITKEIQKANNWLPRYLEEMYNNDEKSKKIFNREIKQKLVEKQQTFLDLAYPSEPSKINTSNTIRCYGVIANALLEECLKNQVMVIKSEDYACGLNLATTKKDKPDEMIFTTLRSDSLKNAQSLIAMCMQRKLIDKDYSNITKAEISNYMRNKKDNISALQKKLCFEKKPLITQKLVGRNSVAMKVNSKWIKNLDVKIVDYSEIGEYEKEKYRIFIDDFENGGVKEYTTNKSKQKSKRSKISLLTN